jgi:hypothetical protein
LPRFPAIRGPFAIGRRRPARAAKALLSRSGSHGRDAADGLKKPWDLDHNGFGLNQSISISMFRSIDIFDLDVSINRHR